MEYKILTDENEDNLRIQVEKAIADGWTIHGFMRVKRDEQSGKDVLSQAMIKDHDNE